MKSRKKRILHVIASLEGGGAERQLQILANNTVDKYRIAILFLHRGSGQYVFDERIAMLHLPRGSKWNLFSLWFSIYKAVMVYQPDILHLWLPEIVTIPAAFAGKFSGAYLLSSARGSRRSVKSIKRRIRRIASYITHVIADKIIVNFNPDGEPWFFRKLFSWKRGCIIRNAILVNPPKNDSPTALLSSNRMCFVIWYVGRFIPSKRLDILLDSFAELKQEGLDISLVICGSGHPKQVRQLKEKVRINALEEHVIFPGYRDDWHSLALDADLFVFPSTSEGMPNALFEAMLLGLPCIATDIQVIRNIVKHKEQVWLVRAGSQISLTEGIREMYNSADLRKKLARNGQRYARIFSIEKMSQAYNTLYQKL